MQQRAGSHRGAPSRRGEGRGRGQGTKAEAFEHPCDGRTWPRRPQGLGGKIPCTHDKGSSGMVGCEGGPWGDSRGVPPFTDHAIVLLGGIIEEYYLLKVSE